jgi:hypothetical protein
MWRAMRMMRSGFHMREMIATAGVKRSAAKKFVRGLARAGYLRAESAGKARRYFLLRDSGPCPPRINRDAKGVALDPNLEIERLRKQHSELLQEIRAIESGLARFGAYISKFEPEIAAHPFPLAVGHHSQERRARARRTPQRALATADAP